MHTSGAHGGGWIYDIMIVCQELDKAKCGFHVHLLAYPFIDRFFTKITALIESAFWNPVEPFYFISFHASKYFYMMCSSNKSHVLYPISFELQRNDI